MTLHLPFLVRDVYSVETVKMFLAKKKKITVFETSVERM